MCLTKRRTKKTVSVLSCLLTVLTLHLLLDVHRVVVAGRLVVGQIIQLHVHRTGGAEGAADALPEEEVPEGAQRRPQTVHRGRRPVDGAARFGVGRPTGQPVLDAGAAEDVLAVGRHQGLVEDVGADGAEELVGDDALEAVHVEAHLGGGGRGGGGHFFGEVRKRRRFTWD